MGARVYCKAPDSAYYGLTLGYGACAEDACVDCVVPGARPRAATAARAERRRASKAARLALCGGDRGENLLTVILAPGRCNDALDRYAAGGPTIDQRHDSVMAHLATLDPARLP